MKINQGYTCDSRFLYALIMMLIVFLAECITGIITRSHSMLTTSLYDFTQLFCISLAFYSSIEKIFDRPTKIYPFGKVRKTLVISMANNSFLLFFGIRYLTQVYEKFQITTKVHNDRPMIIFSLIKSVLNIICIHMYNDTMCCQNSNIIHHKFAGKYIGYLVHIYYMITSLFPKKLDSFEDLSDSPEDKPYIYLSQKNHLCSKHFRTTDHISDGYALPESLKVSLEEEKKAVLYRTDSFSGVGSELDYNIDRVRLSGRVIKCPHAYSYENFNKITLADLASSNLVLEIPIVILYLISRAPTIPSIPHYAILYFEGVITLIHGLCLIHWATVELMFYISITALEPRKHINLEEHSKNLIEEFPVIMQVSEINFLPLLYDYFILIIHMDVSSIDEYSLTYKQMIKYLYKFAGVHEVIIEPTVKKVQELTSY